jgi:hypothetical protein
MATKPAPQPRRPLAKPITPNHSNQSAHSNPAPGSELRLELMAAIQAGRIDPVQLRLPGF